MWRLGDVEIAQDVSELQSHRFRFIQVPTRVRLHARVQEYPKHIDSIMREISRISQRFMPCMYPNGVPTPSLKHP